MTDSVRWIWFRGLVRWGEHWGDFPQEFKKIFPHDEVQMIDLPGLGKFHNDEFPKSMAEVLDHIDREVKGKGPFHILAFSLGAMVAVHWAQRNPKQIQKLFLINTSDARSPFYQRFRPRNWLTVVTKLVGLNAEKAEPAILQMTSNLASRRALVEKAFILAYQKSPFTRRTLLRQLRLASQTVFPVRPVAPTVFLNSHGDQLVHFECSNRLAQLWQMPLETHPHAGHDLALDDPEWVLQKLQHYRS